MRWRLAVSLALWFGTLALPLQMLGARHTDDPAATGLTLQPPLLEIEGCNGLSRLLPFRLANDTGAAAVFALEYQVLGGDAALTGPSQLTLQDGQTADFEVILTPGLCAVPGEAVEARLEASGNGWTAVAEITFTIRTDPHWEPARDHPVACLGWLAESAIDPRDGQEYLYVAGCQTRDTYRYDPRLDTWTTMAASLPGDLLGAGDGAASQGRIYARSVGLGSTIWQLYIYDIASDTWSSAPVLAGIKDRAHYEAVELAGQIYFLGGQDLESGVFSNAVDRYDPATGTWQSTAPMLRSRALAMAWAFQDRIYVAGGLNAGGALSSTESYDPVTDAWSEDPALFAALPAPRYGAGDALLDGQLWLTGGLDTAISGDTFYWSAASNAWQAGPALVTPAFLAESALLAGKLYTVGGSQGDNLWLEDTQRLVVCPEAGDCQGWLEGQVYDAEADATTPTCTTTSLTLTPGGPIPVSPLTGGYGPLPLAPGAYLLEAGAPGYSLELADVVVEHGATTTRDIGLWRPKVSAGPARIEVASPPDTPLTAALWITNTGHLALDYQLVELLSASPSTSATGLPWLSASPTAGEIAPSAATTVALTFACSAAQKGQVLAGSLRLGHSDPCALPFELALRFACLDLRHYVYLPLLSRGDDLNPVSAPGSARQTAAHPRGDPARTRR